MNDAERIQLADEFLNDWFEAEDDDPHDLGNGNPRLACDRVLFVMALVELLSQVEQRTQQGASGPPLVDMETIVRLRVGDV